MGWGGGWGGEGEWGGEEDSLKGGDVGRVVTGNLITRIL